LYDGRFLKKNDRHNKKTRKLANYAIGVVQFYATGEAKSQRNWERFIKKKVNPKKIISVHFLFHRLRSDKKVIVNP
jgi:hypothetical protein